MIMKDVYIFDVDDTLIDTTACVRAVDGTGKIVFKAGTKVFNAPDSTERLLEPGLQWDFSEFTSLHQMIREPHRPPFKVLSTLGENPDNRNKLFIVTARQARDMLYTWLHLEGIPINRNDIYCFDADQFKSVAEYKAHAVNNIIDRCWGDCVVHIWEDDPHFRKAIVNACKSRGIDYVIESID